MVMVILWRCRLQGEDSFHLYKLQGRREAKKAALKQRGRRSLNHHEDIFLKLKNRQGQRQFLPAVQYTPSDLDNRHSYRFV